MTDRAAEWTDAQRNGLTRLVIGGWWKSGRPPPSAPSGWSIRREMHIFRTLVKAGVDMQNIVDYIVGGRLRIDAGELEWAGLSPGDPVSGAFFWAEDEGGNRLHWNENIEAARRKRGDLPSPPQRRARGYDPTSAAGSTDCDPSLGGAIRETIARVQRGESLSAVARGGRGGGRGGGSRG